MTNPTPIFGSGTDAGTKQANSTTSGYSFVDQDTCEYLRDGQPASVHTYGVGDIIGPENGGASYGSLVNVVCGGGPYVGTVLAEVAHKVDFGTLDGYADGNTGSYVWQRIGKKIGSATGSAAFYTIGNPLWSTYVPEQHRIYYEGHAGSNTQPIKWFDTQTNSYTVGS